MGNCFTAPDFTRGKWETLNHRAEREQRYYSSENCYFCSLCFDYHLSFRVCNDSRGCCEHGIFVIQKIRKNIVDGGIQMSTKDYACCCPCFGEKILWTKSNEKMTEEGQHESLLEQRKQEKKQEKEEELMFFNDNMNF